MRVFLRLSGYTNILAAVLLVIGWFSIGIFTWTEISEQNFLAMVLNQAWIPANVTLLIATVLLLPGVIGLFLQLSDKFGIWLLVGSLSAMLAIVWYSCIQFYETFLWPIIAAASPSLFESLGFSASNRIILYLLLASGIPWGIGFLLMGVYTYRSKIVSKWQAIVFTAGAVLFGVGMAFPIRTVGVILFAIGLYCVGMKLRSNDSV